MFFKTAVDVIDDEQRDTLLQKVLGRSWDLGSSGFWDDFISVS